MRRNFLVFGLMLSLCVFAENAKADDIAICGASSGYAYNTNRGLTQLGDVGWDKDEISNGQFTFRQMKDGSYDLLISGALGVSSTVDEGGTIIPATVSDQAVTIVVIYPNRLTETYVFQILKDGKYQAMWTQAKAETPIPRVTAFVANCSYINFSAISASSAVKEPSAVKN